MPVVAKEADVAKGKRVTIEGKVVFGVGPGKKRQDASLLTAPLWYEGPDYSNTHGWAHLFRGSKATVHLKKAKGYVLSKVGAYVFDEAVRYLCFRIQVSYDQRNWETVATKGEDDPHKTTNERGTGKFEVVLPKELRGRRWRYMRFEVLGKQEIHVVRLHAFSYVEHALVPTEDAPTGTREEAPGLFGRFIAGVRDLATEYRKAIIGTLIGFMVAGALAGTAWGLNRVLGWPPMSETLEGTAQLGGVAGVALGIILLVLYVKKICAGLLHAMIATMSWFWRRRRGIALTVLACAATVLLWARYRDLYVLGLSALFLLLGVLASWWLRRDEPKSTLEEAGTFNTEHEAVSLADIQKVIAKKKELIAKEEKQTANLEAIVSRFMRQEKERQQGQP